MAQRDELIRKAEKLASRSVLGSISRKLRLGVNWQSPTMSYSEGSGRSNAIGENIACGSWLSFLPLSLCCPALLRG
jgi:hypothetical protein